MKIAIISDTHFGDDQCSLVRLESNQPVVKEGYSRFKELVGQGNDYLVLAGDILDFSIASYDKAYQCARRFFQEIQKDTIASEIIYVAGNHDADIWHIVQHQRSVINRLEKRKDPEAYEHSVAAIIDDRARSAAECKGLTLDKVTPQQQGGRKYGGMFLDKITTPDTIFNFAYPNLYVVTDNETVLVTHGQYFESYWAILGELATTIARDDLRVGEVDVEEMVEMNFPLNQLACSGIGQAGCLTRLVRQVQRDVKNGDLERIKEYLDRLGKKIDEITDYGWIKELVTDLIIKGAKHELLASLEKMEETRDSEDFFFKQEVQDRLKGFYDSAVLEVASINTRPPFNKPGCGIPAPWKLICGHTHVPIPWNARNLPAVRCISSYAPKLVTVHNTGGWLKKSDGSIPAEIFKYETNAGFSSVTVV